MARVPVWLRHVSGIGADRAQSLVNAWECYGKSRSFSGLAGDLYRATEYLGEGFDNVQP
jgi:hypothetical protein